MTIQELNIGGIDPNCRRPKPRPTTPRDFLESILFQYQKGNWLVISEIWKNSDKSESVVGWLSTDLLLTYTNVLLSSTKFLLASEIHSFPTIFIMWKGVGVIWS